MKPLAMLSDLDGTLFDTGWREHFLKGAVPDYNSFFAGIPKDPPHKLVLKFLQHALDDGYEIIFLTSRWEQYREETATRLEQVDPRFAELKLIMRPDDNRMHDHEFKWQAYKEQIQPLYNVELVLEDRSSVAKMWRKNGVYCWHVAEGNF